MIICVLLCYPVSFHMLQLLLTGRPISSLNVNFAFHFSLMNSNVMCHCNECCLSYFSPSLLPY